MVNAALETQAHILLRTGSFIEKEASRREGLNHGLVSFGELATQMISSDPRAQGQSYLGALAVWASQQATSALECGRFQVGLCYLELAHAATHYNMQIDKTTAWFASMPRLS